MKNEKLIAKMLIKLGKASAQVKTNTNCPWFHYQPLEPKSLIKKRKAKEK